MLPAISIDGDDEVLMLLGI